MDNKKMEEGKGTDDMSKANECAWAIILLFLGAFVGAYLVNSINFIASTDPMQVVVNQGGTSNTLFTVVPGIFYSNDICFQADHVPPYINVHFEPQILNHRSGFFSRCGWNFKNIVNPYGWQKNNTELTSILTVSTEKVASPGEYWISIISDGADGKEQVCKVKIIVIK